MADNNGSDACAPQAATGPRPSFSHATHSAGASAPDFLNFIETDVVLANLSEDDFRQRIAETILALDDLGLNRAKGHDRAEAYLDVVTWDDNYRKLWQDDNSVGSSSCGMFVRNTWWLCGARGTPLMDQPYAGGVLTHCLDFDTRARKRFGSGFTAKTFLPKIGDVFYLYDQQTNSQHIFTICAIDKQIEVGQDGRSICLDDDGSPASVVTFTSIDGGQEDGTGTDSHGQAKRWGCQAVKRVTRRMLLDKGHFLDTIGSAWPLAPGRNGRPINTWLDIAQMQDRFTACYTQPVRSDR